MPLMQPETWQDRKDEMRQSQGSDCKLTNLLCVGTGLLSFSHFSCGYPDAPEPLLQSTTQAPSAGVINEHHDHFSTEAELC